MKSFVILFFILVSSCPSQSQTNVVSRDMSFKETVNFEHQGYQSWIITVMTPDNKSVSYDGCNWHYWGIGFNESVITGSNYTLVILQDESLDVQSNFSNYDSMENVSVTRNFEDYDNSFVDLYLPFYGGNPLQLKVILYYGGSTIGSMKLGGVLFELQTQLACESPMLPAFSVNMIVLPLILIIVVRSRHHTLHS